MTSIGTALRRALFFVVLAAAIGAAVSWRRSQSTTAAPAQPPQWPEWPVTPEPAWVTAHGDGSAPETHPIKVKVSSGIFHVPGGRFYDRTRPDRCYSTAAAAEADGYRRSKT